MQHVVIDTDAFWDADDAVSLAIAGITVDHLTVITSDETGGRRARGVRLLMNALGRTDVEVVAGHELGNHEKFLLDDLIDGVPAQPSDVVGVITQICDASTGRVRWVGQGPMSNLARILTARPHLAEQIQVTQQGGWLDRYRDKTRASTNLRRDQVSAGLALRTSCEPRLLLSDWTHTDELQITRDSELFRMFSAPGVPEWARIVAANLERWLARGKPSKMHDPLALSAALGHEFVAFVPERVRIAADARMTRDRAGRMIWTATGVDYPAFVQWLHAMIFTGLQREVTDAAHR
ncbi:nucleoside hydrolase [Nocardia sp. BMG51109]|uniref:nucleoside hydrolase n=1 Tax=Nocardia sp. BMG51109 TaxID=1056816 RepID=UPI000464EE60|nr:nucleoside hydrolase [Nocardia sp. BMG51109]